jgi:hypothetical protein
MTACYSAFLRVGITNYKMKTHKVIDLVYHEDYMGDEPKSVRAFDHEDAAIKYGQWYNQDDYDLMNETIQVKVEKDGEIKFFEVGVEPDIHYTSKEIDKLDGN